MEVFKTIEGFEDYQISNKGKVMSSKWGRDKLMKPGKDAMGYLHVRLYDGDETRGRYANGDIKPKLEKIHRLVAQHFLPEPDTTTYQEVNHKDGDKQNNDVTNLEWMSRKDNINHAWNTGLNEEGRIAGGKKRRRPVRIVYQDGRVEYYEGRTQAAAYLGVTPMTIIKKFQTNSWGRMKFKAEKINELPQGETYIFSEEGEQRLKEHNVKYFGKLAKWRNKREKKLVE